MGDLERFWQETHEPVLIAAGLVHAQFETVHPFLDGNGRVGRLLVTLMLCNAGVMSEPMLYLSSFFVRNRAHYFDLLTSVRVDGGHRPSAPRDGQVRCTGDRGHQRPRTARSLVHAADRHRLMG